MASRPNRYKGRIRDGYCRHCRQRPGTKSRGLCWRCYADGSILGKYPRANDDAERHETAEEIEALVEEQMKRLPKWWDSEARKARMG